MFGVLMFGIRPRTGDRYFGLTLCKLCCVLFPRSKAHGKQAFACHVGELVDGYAGAITGVGQHT
eukprot:3274372-Heterocapsa_arctica.AAC.1